MSEHKQKSAATVMAPRHTPWWRRRKFLLTAGIIVLLAAAAAYVLPREFRSGKNTVKISSPQQAQQLRFAQGDTAAQQAILQRLNQNQALSPQDKAGLYMQLGFTYSDQHKLAEALAAFQKAFVLQPISSIAEVEGDTSAKLGNKQAAINYYQTAIRLMPNDPRKTADTQIIQNKIKLLQGGQ